MSVALADAGEQHAYAVGGRHPPFCPLYRPWPLSTIADRAGDDPQVERDE